MHLIDTWAPYFPTTVRREGKSVQETGQVQIGRLDDAGTLHAQVRDDDVDYAVEVESTGADATARCSCPESDRDRHCKHIWATIVEADGQLDDLQRQGWNPKSQPPRPPRARRRTEQRRGHGTREPDWSGRLSLLRPSSSAGHEQAARILPGPQRQICYVVLDHLSHRNGVLVIEVRQRHAGAAGWSRLKALRIDPTIVEGFSDAADRQICASLLGAGSVLADELEIAPPAERARNLFSLRRGIQRAVIDQMVRSGRCFLERQARSGGSVQTLALTADPDPDQGAWIFWMIAKTIDDGIEVCVELRRGEKKLTIDEPDLILGGTDGMVFADGAAAPLDDRGATRWLNHFRDEWVTYGRVTPIHVPADDIERFTDRMYLMPDLPELDLPEGLGRPHTQVDPTARLELSESGPGPADPLRASVYFVYDEARVKPGQPGRFISQEGSKSLIRRDQRFERDALGRLAQLGFSADKDEAVPGLILPRQEMHDAVTALIDDDWQVMTEGRTLRPHTTPAFSIRSGIDWFELHGGIRFQTDAGEQLIDLPQILAAAKAGRNLIELGDGSQGLLPRQWLDDHRLLSALGLAETDHLRFKKTQAALLDALLAEQELVAVDETFEQVRACIRRFDRVEPQSPSERFQGHLRPYQQDGLGWIRFLRNLGMGGILADDMGLGKTVQVLAMLDARYAGAGKDDADGGSGLPTLVVVPRSVVYNWIDEAARFTPDLRVVSYGGTDRQTLRDAFSDHDVIVTTYGLLRRDIVELREHRFDYVVLDEAQAIKNPQSQAAKAARLLKSEHRLALTGTPVENHLGDLWSIFEYLNQGLLGSGLKFCDLVRGQSPGESAGGRPTRGSHLQSVDTARQAAVALRPFILRRTKHQVLHELPEKTDQTLLCIMEPEQRKIYDRLLDHYQQTLLGGDRKHKGSGLGKSAFMVLEALLRLRQAACHPGLIDPALADHPSAKLEALVEHLGQLIEEGHKALVFSQFTSMLALVRTRLDRLGVAYEYLDGQTRKRKEHIEHFQNDPQVPIFLISLKAGGQGLNLTAANYVFILDPWWNPAVEVQAIDRVHRIGQTRHVFAYRLICADTVEQRIADLQQQKRKLADAIVDGQENLLQTLTKADLERLLS